VGLLLVVVSLLIGVGCSESAPQPVTTPRIVSLAPSLTEIIYALGAGDLLAGRSTACNYPPEVVARVPAVGGFGAPSLEQLLSVHPTLVLEVDLADETVVRQLESLGIQRVRIPCQKLADIPQAIREVGKYVGCQAEAARMAMHLADELARLAANSAVVTNRPTVFVELWGDPLTTAGAGSFVSELVALSGGKNIGDVSPRDYYQVSAEWVIAMDPEVILCLDAPPGESVRERVEQRPGWNRIKAVRTGRVYDDLNQDIILRPGPRVLEGIAEIRRALGGAAK